MGKNIVEKWGNRKKMGVTRGKEGTKGRKGGQRESKRGVKWGWKRGDKRRAQEVYKCG